MKNNSYYGNNKSHLLDSETVENYSNEKILRLKSSSQLIYYNNSRFISLPESSLSRNKCQKDADFINLRGERVKNFMNILADG